VRSLTKQIGVKMLPSDYDLLKEIARGRGIDVSDFVRQLIRSELARLNYFDDDTKKALGLATRGGRP